MAITMRYVNAMRMFRPLLICCLPLVTFGQTERFGTFSIGAGGGFPASGYRTDPFSNGASFAAAYEFRLWKYVAPHLDLVNLLPNHANYSKFGVSYSRERVTLLSFGVRGVVPLARGRVELFAGPGAVHVWSSQFELTSGFQAPSWLLGIDAGGRMAIDRKHRFWIGPTVRYSRDGGRPTEEWVSLTGDFGVRF
jgi:hypothetical protein